MSICGLGLYHTLWTQTNQPDTSSSELLLALSVDEIKVGEVAEPGTVEKPFGEKIAFMALVATIRNRGNRPTIAEGFTLVFRFPNGSAVSGEPVALPSKMWLSPEEPIFGMDALQIKTASPIPIGDWRQGRLLFFFAA